MDIINILASQQKVRIATEFLANSRRDKKFELWNYARENSVKIVCYYWLPQNLITLLIGGKNSEVNKNSGDQNNLMKNRKTFENGVDIFDKMFHETFKASQHIFDEFKIVFKWI